MSGIKVGLNLGNGIGVNLQAGPVNLNIGVGGVGHNGNEHGPGGQAGGNADVGNEQGNNGPNGNAAQGGNGNHNGQVNAGPGPAGSGQGNAYGIANNNGNGNAYGLANNNGNGKGNAYAYGHSQGNSQALWQYRQSGLTRGWLASLTRRVRNIAIRQPLMNPTTAPASAMRAQLFDLTISLWARWSPLARA